MDRKQHVNWMIGLKCELGQWMAVMCLELMLRSAFSELTVKVQTKRHFIHLITHTERIRPLQCKQQHTMLKTNTNRLFKKKGLGDLRDNLPIHLHII